jgi:RNA polymerase sigma factor (sigma-70 family)
MATTHIHTITRHLRRTVLQQDTTGWTDGQLLASFIDHKDEAAFEALVRRHGSMVFGVCRRIVGNHHDAEDAFQATFLVLARKASSVRPRERVANWLHGVALHTAMKAKAMKAKRRGRELQATAMPEPEAAPQDPWRDLQPLVDQELNGLPENYRLPILLCDLEGKTIKQATQQLGWPQGTLAGRLARGRKLLAKRLANRGVVLSVGALAASVSLNASSASAPASLLSSTVKAAAMIAAGQATLAGVVPAKVATLTEGVLWTMFLSKLKAVVGTLMVVAVLVWGSIALSLAQPPDSPNPKKADPEPKRAAQANPSASVGAKPVPSKNDENAGIASSPRVIGSGRHKYKALFIKALGVLSEHFEIIDHANQYEGRIEGLSTMGARKGVIEIRALDEGGFAVSVRIEEFVVKGTTWQPLGRDSELESAILERLQPGPEKQASPNPQMADPEPKQLKAKEDAAKDMLKRLEGEWKCVSAQVNGKTIEPGAVLTIKGHQWEFMLDGKSETGTFKLVNLHTNPKWINWFHDGKTYEQEGIFMLDGGSLIMCFGVTGVRRPERFYCEPGSDCNALQFIRLPPRPR